MASPNVAIVGSLDPTSYRNLMRDLRALEPEISKELKATFQDLGSDMVRDVKANASWSSRIPSAVSLSVTQTRVGVKASRRKAPHARSYEGISGSGIFGTKSSFRHPVFGNRSVWVNQSTRPFVAPAIRAHQEEFMDRASDAVADAARQVGWK